MNYELAKELKDNGFPQNSKEFYCYDPKDTGIISYTNYKHEKTVDIPTLEELIEACGNNPNGTYFRWLKNEKVQWHAQARRHPASLGDVRSKGSTPSEAVARLWLALNKQKHE